MHIYIHTRLYLPVYTHRHTPTLQPNITHSSCATRSHLNGESTAQTGTNARAAPEGQRGCCTSRPREPLGDTRRGHSSAPSPAPALRAPGSRSPGYRRPEGPLRRGSGARADPSDSPLRSGTWRQPRGPAAAATASPGPARSGRVPGSLPPARPPHGSSGAAMTRFRGSARPAPPS